MATSKDYDEIDGIDGMCHFTAKTMKEDFGSGIFGVLYMCMGYAKRGLQTARGSDTRVLGEEEEKIANIA